MTAAGIWGWIFFMVAVAATIGIVYFNYQVALRNGPAQDRIPLWFPILFLVVTIWILLTNAFYGY